MSLFRKTKQDYPSAVREVPRPRAYAQDMAGQPLHGAQMAIDAYGRADSSVQKSAAVKLSLVEMVPSNQHDVFTRKEKVPGIKTGWTGRPKMNSDGTPKVGTVSIEQADMLMCGNRFVELTLPSEVLDAVNQYREANPVMGDQHPCTPGESMRTLASNVYDGINLEVVAALPTGHTSLMDAARGQLAPHTVVDMGPELGQQDITERTYPSPYGVPNPRIRMNPIWTSQGYDESLLPTAEGIASDPGRMVVDQTTGRTDIMVDSPFQACLLMAAAANEVIPQVNASVGFGVIDEHHFAPLVLFTNPHTGNLCYTGPLPDLPAIGSLVIPSPQALLGEVHVHAAYMATKKLGAQIVADAISGTQTTNEHVQNYIRTTIAPYVVNALKGWGSQVETINHFVQEFYHTINMALLYAVVRKNMTLPGAPLDTHMPDPYLYGRGATDREDLPLYSFLYTNGALQHLLEGRPDVFMQILAGYKPNHMVNPTRTIAEGFRSSSHEVERYGRLLERMIKQELPWYTKVGSAGQGRG
ncbi:MAG: hypothetical protein ABII39_07630 [Candidatus Micrarchaeota archaeon]